MVRLGFKELRRRGKPRATFIISCSFFPYIKGEPKPVSRFPFLSFYFVTSLRKSEKERALLVILNFPWCLVLVFPIIKSSTCSAFLVSTSFS